MKLNEDTRQAKAPHPFQRSSWGWQEYGCPSLGREAAVPTYRQGRRQGLLITAQ